MHDQHRTLLLSGAVLLALAGCGRNGFVRFAPDPDFAFSGVGGAFAGPSGIAVVWNLATGTDGTERYRVFRATSAGGYDLDAPLAELDARGALFMDPEPATTLGTTYYYQVRVAYYGVELGGEVEVFATVLDPNNQGSTVLTFDGLVGAFGLSEGVLVVWNEARGGNGSERYLLSRATAVGGPYVQIADLPAGSILYLDPFPATTPAVSYYYDIEVTYLGNPVSGGMPVTAQVPPPVIESLYFLGAGGAVYTSGAVSILWSIAGGVDPAAVTYNVYRATTSSGQNLNTPTASLPPGTSIYFDTALPDLTAGTTYYYLVRAVYQGSEEQNTREVSATVVVDPPGALSCPAGMANVQQMFCVDLDDHAGIATADGWQQSLAVCISEGKTMCSIFQWYTACAAQQSSGTLGLIDAFDGYEWVSELADTASAYKVGFSPGACDAVSSHTFDGGYNFRCCL